MLNIVVNFAKSDAEFCTTDKNTALIAVNPSDAKPITTKAGSAFPRTLSNSFFENAKTKIRLLSKTNLSLSEQLIW